jgi:hypothetical protein
MLLAGVLEMQDELAVQIVDQLRAMNGSLNAIAKRLDRIELAMKKGGDERELVLLPRQATSTPAPMPPPGSPPIIKSRSGKLGG